MSMTRIQEFQGEIDILGVGRGLDAPHQQVRGIAAGRKPQRPDPALDVFGAVGVGRDLERFEQPVEIDVGIAALRPRQILRRFDHALGFGPRRGRRHDGGKQHDEGSGSESRAHESNVISGGATIKIRNGEAAVMLARVAGRQH